MRDSVKVARKLDTTYLKFMKAVRTRVRLVNLFENTRET